jgi:hypothetical protein
MFKVKIIKKQRRKRYTPSTTLNPRYVRELRGSLGSGEWGLLITTAEASGNIERKNFQMLPE